MITGYLLRNISLLRPRLHLVVVPRLSSSLSNNEYEIAANETLEALSDAFEILLERQKLRSDVTYANGVLTIELDQHGTYVINKQSPNKQIWLSSPFSGPKRYDLEKTGWIYRHDGISLHQLLNRELAKIFPNDKTIDFEKCSYGKSNDQ